MKTNSLNTMTDTRSLLAFAAVIEHGSMNAAAQALNMTPSAVSQHISKLESSHGVKLLKRSTRRLSPTDAGLLLASHCLKLKQALADTQTALDNLKTEAVGEVNIALPSALTIAPVFQAAMRYVAENYPHIRINLMTDDSLVDLQKQNIDIAIRGGDHALDAPDLIARHLADWQWLLCATPSYLTQIGIPKIPKDLYQLRWLSVYSIHYEMQQDNQHHLLSISNAWQCGDLSALKQMTLAGLGASVQLSGEVQELISSGKLEVILPSWKLPHISLYAVTPHRVQAAKIKAVLEVLIQCFNIDNIV